MDRATLKTKAREKISGKILMLLAINIIVVACSGAIGFIPFVGPIASLLIVGSVQLAFAMIYLAIVNHNKKPEIEDIMKGFKNGNFERGFFGYIRYAVFTFLWTLLFVIPGYVKAIAYSQMFFLLADNPDITAGEAQERSMKMMNGHKWEYFVLLLSFIPWYLLCGITFGLAAIYVVPYMQTTFAEYYEHLKKHHGAKA